MRWKSLCLIGILLSVVPLASASMRFGRGSRSISDVRREANTSSEVGAEVNPTTGIFCGGALSTSMNCENFRGRIPVNCRIQRLDATVTTAPTGSDIVIDMNECAPNATLTSMTCTSVWNQSQSQRLRIVKTNVLGYVSYFQDQFIKLGNYIGFDIDQVGSGTAGSNLTVTAVCK